MRTFKITNWELKNYKRELIKFLTRNWERPQPGRKIVDHINATVEAAYCTEPKLRVAINMMRKSGIHILATQNGYYLSHEKAEIKRTIKSLEARIKTMQKSVDGMKKSLKKKKKK